MALHRRFRQRVIGIGGGDVFLRGLQSGIGAGVSGTLLGFVDRDQDFAAPHAIAFVYVDARDGPHDLAGKLRRLRRAHRAGGLHVIWDGGALRGEERDVANNFGRGGRRWLLAGASGESEEERKREESRITIHCVTTGEAGVSVPVASSTPA